jgi:RNase P/RNase MRP subunit p29
MPAELRRPIAASLSAVALAAHPAGADWRPSDLQVFAPQPRATLGGALAIHQPQEAPTTDEPVAATLWAGAPFASGAIRECGVVHAWRFAVNPGGSWGYSWYFGSISPQQGACFGAAIAVSGTTLVVGAPMQRLSATSTSITSAAAGHAEVITLLATNPVSGTAVALPHASPFGGDMYGSAVAVMRASAVIHAVASAPRDDVNGVVDAGSVQCFRRDSNTVWTNVGQAVLPDGQPEDRLGESLATMDDRLFAGVRRGEGLVAAFGFVDGAPVLQSMIAPPDPSARGFGRAMACNGTLLAVGAPGEADSPEVGKVYLLDAAPPHDVRAVVQSPFPTECGGFGATIAFTRNCLVVGTEQGASSIASGKVAVFAVAAGATTAELQFIDGDGLETGFGAAVATGGAHVAIGVPGAGPAVQGVIRAHALVPLPRTPDLNGDGVVSGADLGILLGKFGSFYSRPMDLNYDDRVDGADLGILLGAWGTAG